MVQGKKARAVETTGRVDQHGAAVQLRDLDEILGIELPGPARTNAPQHLQFFAAWKPGQIFAQGFSSPIPYRNFLFADLIPL